MTSQERDKRDLVRDLQRAIRSNGLAGFRVEEALSKGPVPRILNDLRRYPNIPSIVARQTIFRDTFAAMKMEEATTANTVGRRPVAV